LRPHGRIGSFGARRVLLTLAALSSTLPGLFTVAAAPRLGEGDARAGFGPICRGCKQAEPPAGDELRPSLERWNGETLVAAGRSWVVIPALRQAIEEAALRGCAFRVLDGKGLVQMTITGRAQAASSWWRRMRDCPLCRRPVWRMTTNTTRALFAAVRGEIALPRSVYRERWQGDDFFYVDDPGPPIITEHAKRILDRFEISGLLLHPARFVRDRRLWA